MREAARRSTRTTGPVVGGAAFDMKARKHQSNSRTRLSKSSVVTVGYPWLTRLIGKSRDVGSQFRRDVTPDACISQDLRGKNHLSGRAEPAHLVPLGFRQCGLRRGCSDLMYEVQRLAKARASDLCGSVPRADVIVPRCAIHMMPRRTIHWRPDRRWRSIVLERVDREAGWARVSPRSSSGSGDNYRLGR